MTDLKNYYKASEALMELRADFEKYTDIDSMPQSWYDLEVALFSMMLDLKYGDIE